ncbi:MAG: adenosylhopane nucleosidase, partial [Rhodoplanes sp.]
MIVVVGLAFEARIAAGPGVRVICSGDGRNLVSSLAKAIKEARLRKMDCGGLISFGVAGGLDPELQPGTCVVGSTIHMESHIVASLARKHDIPMAAIRVITDPAERALPACAVSAMRPNGTTDILAMIRSVMT